MLFFVNLEKNKKSVTIPINKRQLSLNTNCSFDATRQALRRLKRMKFIKIIGYSKDRYNGYSIYKILPPLIKNISLYNNSNNYIINTTIKKEDTNMKTTVNSAKQTSISNQIGYTNLEINNQSNAFNQNILNQIKNITQLSVAQQNQSTPESKNQKVTYNQL